MQLSYSTDMSPAREGQLADTGNNDVMTKENTATAIFFGKFVSRGAADKSCIRPAAAADITDAKKALGVAISHQALESSATGDPEYPVNSAVNVLKKGRVWVEVEEAVTPLDPVYVRYAAGAGGTVLGSFRMSADTATAGLLAGAKYLSTAAAAGLALLELDI